MNISVKTRLRVLYALAISITVTNIFSYGFLEFIDSQPRPYVIMWMLFLTGSLSFFLEIFSAIFCRPSKIKKIIQIMEINIGKRSLGMLNIMYMPVILGLVLWVLPLSIGLSIVTEPLLRKFVAHTVIWFSILSGIVSIFIIFFCKPSRIVKLIGENNGDV